MVDPTGVSIDVIDDAGTPLGTSRLRHVRATVINLAKSVSWYEGLGFNVVETSVVDDGAFIGHQDEIRAEAVRLGRSDESFEVLLLCNGFRRVHTGVTTRSPTTRACTASRCASTILGATYTEMAAAGCAFDRTPASVELNGTSVPPMWICFLSDPDGIPYEFVERPRSAFRG